MWNWGVWGFLTGTVHTVSEPTSRWRLTQKFWQYHRKLSPVLWNSKLMHFHKYQRAVFHKHVLSALAILLQRKKISCCLQISITMLDLKLKYDLLIDANIASFRWPPPISTFETGSIVLRITRWWLWLSAGKIRRVHSRLKQQTSKGYYHRCQFSRQVNNLAFSTSPSNYSDSATFNCESHQKRRWQGGKTLTNTEVPSEWLGL